MATKYNLSPTEKLNYVQKGKPKGQFKKAFKQVLLSFVLIGLFILMFVPYLRNYKKNKIMDTEIAEAKANINQYEKTNEELKIITSYLSTNQAVEEKARLNLGLQKAGEKVVVIKKDENEDINTSTEEKIELPNYKRWFNYFFNN